MEPLPTSPSATEWATWLAEAERRLREVYKLSPERLIAEYRREREVTRGYHGREILELLQNAADAARNIGVPGRVRIVVMPYGLVMGNTGLPFNTGGVQSLQTANLSPKRQREAVVIGDKGLGFRSILNWTDSPLISSGELGLAFLPEYAGAVLNRLAEECKDLAHRVSDEREITGDLIVPRLAFPQWIPNWDSDTSQEDEGVRAIAATCAKLRREGFDTVVGMPFSNSRAYGEAVQQVDELRLEFLLLVDAIVSLGIQIHGREEKVWSCERSEGRCVLRKGLNDVSGWTVKSYGGEVPAELLDHGQGAKNRFQITIAIPDSAKASPGVLFCYFPTEVQIPLPLLAHATVELDETRKHVNNTRANRHILNVMCEHIADLAEKQIERDRSGPWTGCGLVTATGMWGGELVRFGFPAALKAAARKKNLIPAIGGGHRSASNAKLAPGETVKWWPVRLFTELAAVETKRQQRLAEEHGVQELETGEIVKVLLAADELTLDERARVIVGLIHSSPPPEDANLSTLLCDETATPLPPGVAAILQPAGELAQLPTWATIRFLHPELRARVETLLETKDSRELQQKLRPFGVVEYSLAALIRPVMAEANRQVNDRPADESLIRKEALAFLWQIYQGMGTETAFPTEATVRLLNQEGTWTQPKKLYLGEGYGLDGNITQGLYAGWANERLVAGAELLGLPATADWGNVARFLVWLGVARWPREMDVESLEPAYIEMVKSTLRYPVDFGEFRYSSPSELTLMIVDGAMTLDGISGILRAASPEVVLAWVVSDTRCATWMRPSTDHGTLKICPPYKQIYRKYTGVVPSYIHWQISTFPWLPSGDGTRRAPVNCLLGERHLDVLFPSPTYPDAELLARYGISNRVSEAFRAVGVMTGLSQLGRDELYRLLLEAPELSPDGKACRALCRWFVANEGYFYEPAGSYQAKFFEVGKVWGTKKGVSGYYPISELRHVDQEGFPPSLTSKLAIADLGKRIGAQKVHDILGIRPLERSEIKQSLISHRPSPKKDNWAAWFNEGKPFIRQLRQTQTKQAQAVGAFDRLSLVVCDELRVQMKYGKATYEHEALEGEWFVFSDHLYVRGDLDDSRDLLADGVGVALASVFGMAEGDAFAKILLCKPTNRSKLLRRMSGDDFQEEIEAAIAKAQPGYAGPIHPPTAPHPNQEVGIQEDEEVEVCSENVAEGGELEPKIPGVMEVLHVPLPPPVNRKIIIRNVLRSTGGANGPRTMVNGERCERMAVAFEEQVNPRRYALGVGHITGLDAPGFDLVSFATEAELDEFQNPATRDWSKVKRFIEVKGRSSATAKIELKGNELRAAREYTDRYFLYRFYEAADGQFYVSLLRDPMAADEALETIIEVDLDRADLTKRFDFIVDEDGNVEKGGAPETQPPQS